MSLVFNRESRKRLPLKVSIKDSTRASIIKSVMQNHKLIVASNSKQ